MSGHTLGQQRLKGGDLRGGRESKREQLRSLGDALLAESVEPVTWSEAWR